MCGLTRRARVGSLSQGRAEERLGAKDFAEPLTSAQALSQQAEEVMAIAAAAEPLRAGDARAVAHPAGRPGGAAEQDPFARVRRVARSPAEGRECEPPPT